MSYSLAEAVRRRYGITYVKREYANEMKFAEAKPLYKGKD